MAANFGYFCKPGNKIMITNELLAVKYFIYKLLDKEPDGIHHEVLPWNLIGLVTSPLMSSFSMFYNIEKKTTQPNLS